MIAWSGWGILALPLFALGFLGGTTIGEFLAGGDVSGPMATNLGTVAGGLLASVAVWFLGRRLNQPRSGFDPRTGQPVVHRNAHRFFFVPVQYLAFAGAALSLWFAVEALGRP